jgi:hypothetical protein
MPAWSYSALTSYETCPRRHYETRVAKTTKDPKGGPALIGDRAHKVLEQRALKGTEIPTTLKVSDPTAGTMVSLSTEGWERYISRILAAPGELQAESQYALNKKLQRVEWFAKDVWVRVIIDLAKINGTKGMMFDWKTGKRDPDTDQLKLFAAVGFHVWPALETIDTAFIWLKTGEIDRERFSRSDIPNIWSEFIPRVKRLDVAHAENKWEPKPSGLCKKWCPVVSCVHNGNHVPT